MKSIQNKILLILIIMALLPACASLTEINMAQHEIDRVWKVKNDKIRQELGSALVDATPEEAFDALANTVEALGFTISEQNRDTGHLFAVAPAPKPLNEEEWEEGRKVDEPEAKAIFAKTMPVTSLFVFLHTDEVEIHILATVLPVETGTKISFEYTIVDHKALNMGVYAPKNPPPSLARIGLIKTWKVFERQLNLVQSKS